MLFNCLGDVGSMLFNQTDEPYTKENKMIKPERFWTTSAIWTSSMIQVWWEIRLRYPWNGLRIIGKKHI